MSDQTALQQSVASSFAGMAFLDVVKGRSEDAGPVAQILRIEFSRPVRGILVLFLPLQLKQQIIENALGSDWDSVASDTIDDCLLEMVNIITGNYLRARYGEDSKIELHFPSVLFGEDELEDDINYVYYYFDAEGITFKAALYIE